jgi:hypothetical protein
MKIATSAWNYIFLCGVILNAVHISGCTRAYNICFQYIIIVHSRHCLCYKEKRPIWRITFLQSSPSHETFRGKLGTSAICHLLASFMFFKGKKVSYLWVKLKHFRLTAGSPLYIWKIFMDCTWSILSPSHESASELYRPRDRRLSAKLVPTYADRGWHVVSVMDPYGRILGFLDQELKETVVIYKLPMMNIRIHCL